MLFCYFYLRITRELLKSWEINKQITPRWMISVVNVPKNDLLQGIAECFLNTEKYFPFSLYSHSSTDVHFHPLLRPASNLETAFEAGFLIHKKKFWNEPNRSWFFSTRRTSGETPCKYLSFDSYNIEAMRLKLQVKDSFLNQQ